MLRLLKACLGLDGDDTAATVAVDKSDVRPNRPGEPPTAAGLAAAGQQQPTDIIHVQMVFLFAMIWGLCSTLSSFQARKKFDVHFRNLVDGLVKGHAKPASFRLSRANLMPDTGSVFDYMMDPNKPGQWFKWADHHHQHQAGGNNQFLQAKAPGGASALQQQHISDEPLDVLGAGGPTMVPTTETAKQTFFLKLALSHCIPLGTTWFLSMVSCLT